MGLELLSKVKDELSDIAQVDQEPSLEGRQLLMILSPLKKKIKNYGIQIKKTFWSYKAI